MLLVPPSPTASVPAAANRRFPGPSPVLDLLLCSKRSENTGTLPRSGTSFFYKKGASVQVGLGSPECPDVPAFPEALRAASAADFYSKHD